MLTPNELMTWNEMKERYPSRWVFVEVKKGEGINIEEGIVRAVAEDGKLAEAWDYCTAHGWKFMYKRTSAEPFMGIVDCINCSVVSEEVVESVR